MLESLIPKVISDVGIVQSYAELGLDPGAKTAHSHSHTCTQSLVTDSDSDS